MHAVLRRLTFRDKLEEHTRPAAIHPFHKYGRIVLWVVDPFGAQASQLCFVIRSNLIAVQCRGPEAGNRRRVTAIDNDVMDMGHTVIMHNQPRAHDLILMLRWQGQRQARRPEPIWAKRSRSR